MNQTMISFLTNEQTPERLKDALKNLKQKDRRDASPKKDKLLVILGAGVLVFFILLVLSVILLY